MKAVWLARVGLRRHLSMTHVGRSLRIRRIPRRIYATRGNPSRKRLSWRHNRQRPLLSPRGPRQRLPPLRCVVHAVYLPESTHAILPARPAALSAASPVRRAALLRHLQVRRLARSSARSPGRSVPSLVDLLERRSPGSSAVPQDVPRAQPSAGPSTTTCSTTISAWLAGTRSASRKTDLGPQQPAFASPLFPICPALAGLYALV